MQNCTRLPRKARRSQDLLKRLIKEVGGACCGSSASSNTSRRSLTSGLTCNLIVGFRFDLGGLVGIELAEPSRSSSNKLSGLFGEDGVESFSVHSSASSAGGDSGDSASTIPSSSSAG